MLLGAAGILIVLVWGYNAVVESVTYYRGVDEVAAHPELYADRPVWMIGDIVNGSFKPEEDGYRFIMELNGTRMQVHYSGALPPVFQESGRVVVKGVVERNRFSASRMQVKCPTKYTSP